MIWISPESDWTDDMKNERAGGDLLLPLVLASGISSSEDDILYWLQYVVRVG